MRPLAGASGLAQYLSYVKPVQTLCSARMTASKHRRTRKLITGCPPMLIAEQHAPARVELQRAAAVAAEMPRRLKFRLCGLDCVGKALIDRNKAPPRPDDTSTERERTEGGQRFYHRRPLPHTQAIQAARSMPRIRSLNRSQKK